MRLVVQIPCLNEEKTLPQVLADIPREVEGVDDVQILVVDDGSTDRTVEVAREHGATRVVSNRGNRGLAQTFVRALDVALEMGADVIVNTDGDHQYPGERIPELVAPILRGEADLVIGNRQTQIDPKVPPKKKVFYRLGNFVVRTVAGIRINDAPSGFRAMSRDFAMNVYLTNPFSYTIETIFAAAENRQPIREVPIATNAPRRKSRLFRGIAQYIGRSATIILRGYSMHNPVKAFAVASLPFVFLGLALGIRFLYFYLENPAASGHVQSLILAAICLVVGAQIMIFGLLGGLVRTNRLLLQDVRMRIRRLELDSSRDSSAN